MNKQEKEEFVADLHGRLEKAQGVFVVDYQGLNVEAINKLRGELRREAVEFKVVKNRLLKLASQSTDTASIQDQMQGATAIALTYDDVIAPAKVLIDFAKDFKQLKIKCAQISGKVVDGDSIKQLAGLPSKDVLLAQTLSAMHAVPTSFVRVLSCVIGKFMNVLQAIEQKKSE